MRGTRIDCVVLNFNREALAAGLQSMEKMTGSVGVLPSGMSQDELEHNFVLIKLFEMLRAQRWSVRLGSLGVPGVLAAIAYANTDQWAWFLVLLPVLLLQVVRAWVVGHRIPEPHETPLVQKWLDRMVVNAVLTGLTQALILLSFPYISDISRGMYTLLLLSYVTAAVSSNAGQPRIYRAFVWSLALPLAVQWARVPGTYYSEATGWGVALLVLMMLFLMLHGYNKTAWHLFDESCRIRFREHGLNARLNAALEDAHLASQAKTRFLASASHDLRQPLHVISLVTAALKMRPLDTETAEMVSLLDRVSASLNAQLSSLLDISKLDAGLVKPNWARMDVAQFMQLNFESVAPLARAKGLEPILRVETSAVVVTDQALLQRMFTNLCQNALKYTSRGHILLSACDRGDFVAISVSDSGCGIESEDQKRVFQEFVQVGNPERDASQGLGLGLSLVQRLSQLLEVDVRLVSCPGVGTEVSLSMLRALPQPGKGRTDAGQRLPVVGRRSLNLTVLVIDDDVAVCRACAMLLEALGCVVMLAQNQHEAEAALAGSRPDVLLVDLRLRDGVNGIDVIRHLRGILGPVPAVLVSGDTSPDRLRMAAEAGIPMCTKPLTLEQLMAELVPIQKQNAQAVH